MKYTTQCHFSDPVDNQGNTPSNSQTPWNFASVQCTTTDPHLTLITNSSTSASFYSNSSITYGDFLVVIFLSLFLIFGILKFFITLIIPRRIDFKR